MRSAWKRSKRFVPWCQRVLHWMLMFDAVSCTIPGSQRAEQVADISAASSPSPLSEEPMAAVDEIYDRLIRPHVHRRF